LPRKKIKKSAKEYRRFDELPLPFLTSLKRTTFHEEFLADLSPILSFTPITMIKKYVQGETGRNPAIVVPAFPGPRDDEFLAGMATHCSECAEDTLSDQKQ
jgi:hypothetical protein